ncbi:MAG TPA: DegV family protein [Acidimicrobiia bacterium]|nr:DegV family protein [Acidimicrobiia bacterium]
MIALVTDSNAQLPDALRDRFGVHVVPLTVVVDGEDRLEGVDLGADEFYARLAAGATVSTAAPAPGRVLEVLEAAASAGAAGILAVHIGSSSSATVSAVHLAARESTVPVEIVDTGTASFPIACSVWAAGLVLERGGDLGEAAAAARAVAATVGNVFVVGALDLARRGGRLSSDVTDDDGVPVLALVGGTMEMVGRARDLEEAVGQMDSYYARWADGRPSYVGVGDAVAPELAESLADRLRDRPETVELVRYAIGPSVGVHSGPGTAGAVFFPAALAGPRSPGVTQP